MDRIFQIGDFVFRLCCPEEVTPPENFMKFECESDSAEYTYQIKVSNTLPDPEGKLIAQRPDLAVFRCETEKRENFECRLIGVKGAKGSLCLLPGSGRGQGGDCACKR